MKNEDNTGDHVGATTDVEKGEDTPSSASLETQDATVPWEHPSNKRNPQNWSVPLKIMHTFIPCCLSFSITFTTSITVPATAILAREFGLSRTMSLLPLTLYTLGVGFGPLFIAPLSEAFGRRMIYLSTHLAFSLFILGAALSQTYSGVLACRFLAGFLGSAGVAIGAGTVSEIWSRKAAGGAALFFILGPFLGPTLGPLAGAYVLRSHNNNWRWTQYTILILSAPIFIGLLLMKETHKATILKGKNKTTTKEIVQLMKVALVRPTKMLCTEFIVASLTLYTAYAYAMIFSFFASASYVLPLYYGFDSRQVGLSLLAVIIGYCLASFLFGVFDKTLYARAARKLPPGGVPAPEHRLYSGLVGSVMIPVSLFWYAWEARRGGNWAALVAAGIPFGFGSFSLFLSAITYQVDVYLAGAAASALAANGTLRYTLGAVFPLFTVQMYERLGVQWAGSTFAFLSLVLLPIPWLLFKYGPKLRERDRKF
ncbi:MFS transporter-like protein 115 [Elsinoe australis]|uniref:MFS transporter-like protein 115 n=1 Tax=Elsinoe australis TaxID=40998 RepID=A0A4U7AYK9_9PEZI|nr:MFS transporter-like protein 115 [Elsinoe australis]